jgi:hypothetical protein
MFNYTMREERLARFRCAITLAHGSIHSAALQRRQMESERA